MKLLIYREDSKVLVKDGELPEITSDDYEEIKKFVLENIGFHIILSGKRNSWYIVAKIISGSAEEGYKFEEIVSKKLGDLVKEDTEYWQQKALS